MKKVYYLWLRQIKKYLRSRSRMLGSFFQPLLYLVAMGYGFGSVFSQAGQGSYLDFLAPGVIGMSIIFTSMFSGMEVLWDRQFGFLKETLVAPMPRFNIMLGRTLGSATVATLQGVIVMLMSFILVTHLMGWLSILQAIGVMFLIATLFTSLSTMIASLLKDMQGFQAIMNFLIMPLFMLSGSLFPLQGLPDLLSLVTRIDPLSYGIDALRALFINTSQFGLITDVSVLGATTLLFLWLGGHFFKKIQV
ncbi:ABC transporter permease [Candidatus Acetothermia bacterium]|nr:ABC transporter permease [Candidatus Acetothermia bacterium]MBI3644287.1 ABC transporter permease [Candidatus Acetothermia bacterium]